MGGYVSERMLQLIIECARADEQRKQMPIITKLIEDNKQLKEELHLASLPQPKKPIDEEIAELQERIMKLYAEKDKN